MDKYSPKLFDKCSNEYTLVGDPITVDKNLIIIQVWQTFLCLTSQDIDPNGYKKVYAKQITLENDEVIAKDILTDVYILPFVNIFVDLTFKDLIDKKINSMQLQPTNKRRVDFVAVGEPRRVTNIYKVVEIKRCQLFQDCKEGEDRFGEKPIEEFKLTEEMKNIIDEANKQQAQSRLLLEQKYTLTVTDNIVKNNDHMKYIIVDESIEKLDISNFDNLESVKTNNLKKLRISNCPKLINIFFNENFKYLYIERCGLKILNLSNVHLKNVEIDRCNNLESLILNNDLEEIGISKCEKLINIEFGEKIKNLMISYCGIENINIESDIILKQYTIEHCNNLQNATILSSNYIEKLNIWNCAVLNNINISKTTGVSLYGLNFMNLPKFDNDIEELKIHKCENMEHINIPQKVREMYLNGDKIKEIDVPGGVLEKLRIDCMNLEKIFFEESKTLKHLNIVESPKLEYLQMLPNSIEELFLKCSKLKTISNIPTNLRKFNCDNCKKLYLQPLANNIRFICMNCDPNITRKKF